MNDLEKAEYFSIYSFFYSFDILQGEAVGFSLWRGDEVHLRQILWVSAAAEGEHQGFKLKL